MSIQGNINGMLGTAAALATAGKHISNQNKEIAVKKIEAEKDLATAETELENKKFEISSEMDKDTTLTAEQRGLLKSMEPGQDIDAYLGFKSDQAMENTVKAQTEFDERMNKFYSGEQKTAPSSKRLDKMKLALQESNDEINAYNTLLKNKEAQLAKIKALGGNK